MSLILEALRKSEAERQRGQQPDLHTELAPPAAHLQLQSRHRRWPWLLAGALVCAALGVAFLKMRTATTTDATHAANPPATTVHTPAPTPAAAEFPQLLPSASAPPTQPPPAPRQTQPAHTNATTTAPPASTRTAAAPLPAPVNMQQSPPAHTAAPTAASSATISPPAEPIATATPTTGPTTLSALPASVRQQLPALQIRMHFYDADPAQRFVVIDGVRLQQGDDYGTLKQLRIERDSVLFELNGQQLRIPLR